MVAVLKLYDEDIGKGRALHGELRLACEQATVADILRARIEADLATVKATSDAAADLHAARVRQWMIVPSLKEQALNGERGFYGPGTAQGRSHDGPDPDALLARAVEGLRKNRFLMFIDDRQVTAPDERISVRPDSAVVFIRLTPLVGG